MVGDLVALVAWEAMAVGRVGAAGGTETEATRGAGGGTALEEEAMAAVEADTGLPKVVAVKAELAKAVAMVEMAGKVEAVDLVGTAEVEETEAALGPRIS